jgi:hypothetical protein
MQSSSKRLRIDHLIHMSDESAPLPFDDLADNACDLLDLCHRSGLEVGPETKMIELAISMQIIRGSKNSLRASTPSLNMAVLMPLQRLPRLRLRSPILLQ